RTRRTASNARVDSGGDLVLVPAARRGGVPEWLKGADCKSAGVRLRWFESNPLHQLETMLNQSLTITLRRSRFTSGKAPVARARPPTHPIACVSSPKDRWAD